MYSYVRTYTKIYLVFVTKDLSARKYTGANVALMTVGLYLWFGALGLCVLVGIALRTKHCYRGMYKYVRI